MAGNYQVKMDYQEVIQLAELKYSPFKDRICRVSLVLSVCFSLIIFASPASAVQLCGWYVLNQEVVVYYTNILTRV